MKQDLLLDSQIKIAYHWRKYKRDKERELERKRREEEERRNRKKKTNNYMPGKANYDNLGNRVKPNGSTSGENSPTRSQISTNAVANKIIQKISPSKA